MRQQNSTLILNMEMLADAYMDLDLEIQCYFGYKPCQLTGVRFYTNEEKLQSRFVYITDAEDMPEDIPADGSYAFIVRGRLEENRRPACSIIETAEEIDLSTSFNLTAKVFEKYTRWDMELQNALNEDAGILELCSISVNFFNNPLFVHDAQFYIIACPIHLKGMTEWEKDGRTGRYMVPLKDIDYFDEDREYQHSLTTRSASIFPEQYRGYRMLYMNLWNDGRYEGRICINEMMSPLQKGHFHALEHFSKIVQIAIRRRNLEPGKFSRPFESILEDMLSRSIKDAQVVSDHIQRMGWRLSDKYIWIKIAIDERNVAPMAAVRICNRIEVLLPGGYAFLHENNILVIVNITGTGMTPEDAVKKLKTITDEERFKAGVSNVFTDFMKMADFSHQASIALKMGLKNEHEEWYYLFKDFALEYIIENACGGYPGELLCSGEIQKLKRYDDENETELYDTLRLYLRNDKNAVQTAKDLYIHRSTLLYRMERIMEMTKIDLDDPREKLYLNLSFEILTTVGWTPDIPIEIRRVDSNADVGGKPQR